MIDTSKWKKVPIEKVVKFRKMRFHNMIKVIEVFGGIGSIHKALSNIKKYHNGLNYKVIDMVDHNKTAVKAYNAIHNTKFAPQDILTCV